MSSHSIDLITTTSAFEAILPTWKKLQAEMFDPYLSSSWYFAWWQSFGATQDLWLLHIKEPIEAIVPLYRKDGLLQFIGNQYSHRHGFASLDEPRNVWENLLFYLERGTDWDGVELTHLTTTSSQNQCLSSLLGTEQSTWKRQEDESESWAIFEQHSWGEHLLQQHKTARKKRRKLHHRLEEWNDGFFQTYTTPEEAKQFVRVYFQIVARSWKPPESSRDFFRRICQKSAQEGSFRSHVLFSKGNQPIACQMGFLCGHTYHCYKTAYDQQFSSVMPGLAVMDLAFSEAANMGAKKIDLLTGTDDYKRTWCNHIIPQNKILWGKQVTLPAPASLHRPPTMHVECSRESLIKYPTSSEKWCTTQNLPLIQMAIAMGSKSLQVIKKMQDNDKFIGFAHEHQGVYSDVVWFECEESTAFIHLPLPSIRTPRIERLSFLSTVFCQLPERITKLQATLPIAYQSLFKDLGFATTPQSQEE